MRYSENFRQQNKQKIDSYFERFPQSMEFLFQRVESDINVLISMCKNDKPIHLQYDEIEKTKKNIFTPGLNIHSIFRGDLLRHVNQGIYSDLEINRANIIRALKFNEIEIPSRNDLESFFSSLKELSKECATFCIDEFKKDIMKNKENYSGDGFTSRLRSGTLEPVIRE